MTRTLLLAAALLGSTLLPAQSGRAQGLAPMVGASAIQGTLQGTATPAYTGVLDKARTTVGSATAQTGTSPSPGSGTGPAAAPTGPTGASSNLASSAPSGASVNGQPIPLCSHGGLCQGALMRAMGQP